MAKTYTYNFEMPHYLGHYRIENAKGSVVLWGIKKLETAKKAAVKYLKTHPNNRVVTITKDIGKVTKYVK